MEWTRREFLRTGAAGLGLTFYEASRSLAFSTSGPALSHDRVLVLLQLSGGNDGLSTVVPYGHDAYGKNRDRTRVPTSSLFKLNPMLGLHPRLGGFKELYDSGDLAIVQGVGYPQPNRSHFESMDIWHAADLRGRLAGQGWVGRFADVAFAGSDDPNLVVHIGTRTPFSLQANIRHPVALSTPEAYRWLGAKTEVRALEEAAPCCEEKASDPSSTSASSPGTNPLHRGRDQAVARLRRTLQEAQASSDLVRQAASRYRPRADYPPTPLAGSLATVAALLVGGLSTRIYSVQTSGYDTHVSQRKTHDRLLGDLGESVGAFMRDLKAHRVAHRVCLVAFSEFGRRVPENASQGTDHGRAGPMFMISPKIRGGLHSQHPSLTRLDQGDLIHTVDFRQVYGTLIDGWMGGDHREVLGRRFEGLKLFTS